MIHYFIISRRLAISCGYFGRSRRDFLLCWRFNCRSVVCNNSNRYIHTYGIIEDPNTANHYNAIKYKFYFHFIVILMKNRVLTASHCIGKYVSIHFNSFDRAYEKKRHISLYFLLPCFSKSLHNINNWTIQLGITRRNSHTYYGQKVKVQRVLPHPFYNVDVMHDNDIALFQVRTFFFKRRSAMNAYQIVQFIFDISFGV